MTGDWIYLGLAAAAALVALAALALLGRWDARRWSRRPCPFCGRPFGSASIVPWEKEATEDSICCHEEGIQIRCMSCGHTHRFRRDGTLLQDSGGGSGGPAV